MRNTPSLIEYLGPGGRLLRFVNTARVYPVNQYQSLFLASRTYQELLEQVVENRTAPERIKAVEACCGGGPVAVTLKAAGVGWVEAFDLSPSAVSLCQKNARINRLTLDSLHTGNLLSDSAFLGSDYDMIVCNPPCGRTELCQPGLSPLLRRSVDGGISGTDFYFPLIEKSRRLLRRGGRLVFVLTSTTDFPAICAALQKHYPDNWRMSYGSPVASPFELQGSMTWPLLKRLCRERTALAWKRPDGVVWRLSWVLVALNEPVRPLGSAAGKLLFDNQTHLITEPSYLAAMRHWNQGTTPATDSRDTRKG